MDVENFANNFTHSVGNGLFKNVFKNPIYVAVLITSVIILIILFMYKQGRLVKTSVYIFLTTLFIIFIHNKLLLIDHKKSLYSQDSENIVNAIGGSSFSMNNVLDTGEGERSAVDGLNYLNV
jgi:hypothetical protein